MATELKPKKSEKRPAFLNRDGDAFTWRTENLFSFEFDAPEFMSPLIENKEAGEFLRVNIAGDIMDIEAAVSFVDLLQNNADADLALSINSKGGSVEQGMMMFNAMKEHRGHITTTITGEAASTALTIAMGGDTIEAHENTTLMMHPAHALGLMAFTGHSTAGLEAAEFVQEMANKATDQIIDLLSVRSGQTRGKVEKLVNAKGGSGTTLTASEAVDLGFVDTLIANEPRKKNVSRAVTMQAWQEQHLANAKRMQLSGLL